MNNMGIGQLLSRFSGFIQNPAQMLQQMGLPADALKNPQATIQQLMNSGKMNQQQYNQLQQMANSITQNPAFAQMFGKK